MNIYAGGDPRLENNNIAGHDGNSKTAIVSQCSGDSPKY